jgi:hypothetical protein
VRRLIFCVLIPLLLGACANTNLTESFEYTASDEKALLAISFHGFDSEYLHTETYVALRRVDIDAQRFFGDPVIITSCGACITTGIGTYSFPEKFKNLSDFRMAKLDPGIYGVLGTQTIVNIGYSKNITQDCFSSGIPIIEISTARVNVFHARANQKTTNIENLKEVFAYYQGIKAPVIGATVHALASAKNYQCEVLAKQTNSFNIQEMIEN